MQKVDLVELRRLHEAAIQETSTPQDLRRSMNAAYLALPALLDELEAAREELHGWRHERAMTIEAFRLVQNGLDPKLIGHPNGSEFGDALRAMLHARDSRMKLIGAAEELETWAEFFGGIKAIQPAPKFWQGKEEGFATAAKKLKERAAKLRQEAADAQR